MKLLRSLWTPRRPRLLVLSLATAALLWQCRHIPTYVPAVMQTFASTTRTHCVGRYLIDLPTDLGSPWLSSLVLYFGLGTEFEDIEFRMPQPDDIDRATFDRLVHARQTELATTRNSQLDTPMLLASEKIETKNGPATLLRRLSNDSGAVFTLISEIHEFVGGRYVILQVKSYPEESTYKNRTPDLYKTVDPSITEARLVLIARNLFRVTNPKTARPGFCFNDVLIDPRQLHYSDERASFHFETHGGKGARLNLEISMQGMGGYEEKSLLEREEERLKAVGRFPMHILARTARRGERNIDGVRFQEWGGEFYLFADRSTQYSFSAENTAPADDQKSFARPAIGIELQSGGNGQDQNASPYDLHQIEQAWDQWLSTLRLSPANGGKTI